MEHLIGIDLPTLVRTIGYLGVAGIVFAESGLLVGFFLPGDSLLFTAGLLASQGYFSYPLLAFVVFISAILGDAVGYAFGRRVGPKIFSRKGSLFFDPEHLNRATAFYERHGGKAIILARFMPFIRTFAPIVAGIGQMHYGRFVIFNVIGALCWAVGISFLGYFLGETIPGVDQYLLPIIAAIIIASVSPALIHILRNPVERKRVLRLITRGYFGSR
jgi:membrane-associated protein